MHPSVKHNYHLKQNLSHCRYLNSNVITIQTQFLTVNHCNISVLCFWTETLMVCFLSFTLSFRHHNLFWTSTIFKWIHVPTLTTLIRFSLMNVNLHIDFTIIITFHMKKICNINCVILLHIYIINCLTLIWSFQL